MLISVQVFGVAERRLGSADRCLGSNFTPWRALDDVAKGTSPLASMSRLRL